MDFRGARERVRRTLTYSTLALDYKLLVFWLVVDASGSEEDRAAARSWARRALGRLSSGSSPFHPFTARTGPDDDAGASQTTRVSFARRLRGRASLSFAERPRPFSAGRGRARGTDRTRGLLAAPRDATARARCRSTTLLSTLASRGALVTASRGLDARCARSPDRFPAFTTPTLSTLRAS